MKFSDIITIRKSTIKPRKVYAQLGGFEGQALTEENAVSDLVDQIERAHRNGMYRDYRFANDGAVFVLYFAFDSWCYDIVRPTTTNGSHSSCHTSARTRTDALEMMLNHIAQYNESVA